MNNITQDGLSYGFVINSDINYTDKSTSASYTFNIDGKLSNVTSSGTVYFAQEGQAAKFLYLDGKLEHVDPLYKLDTDITGVDNVYLYSGTQKYLLGKKVLIYRYSRLLDATVTYMPTDLSEIVGKKDLKMEAYYDNLEVNGGRIRVIVIKP